MRMAGIQLVGRVLFTQSRLRSPALQQVSPLCLHARLMCTTRAGGSGGDKARIWGVPEGGAPAPGPPAPVSEPSIGDELSDSDLAAEPRTIEPRLAQGVEVGYARGLPQITVPLPSRRDKCRFTLKPISNTVGDFIEQLHSEDRGIDRVVLRTLRGTRIATSDSIEALMEEDFELIINDDVYHVKTPELERPSQEELSTLSNVRNLVSQLYEALNVEEHQLKKEREMIAQLEDLRVQLEPMEKKKLELEAACHRKTSMQTWIGLGLMGVQFGILARLTWWEYSWDIMEPVTYFVTYGTAMAAYAYFVITKQDYILPDVRDRSFLLSFYRRSRKGGLDVRKYNELRDTVHRLEEDLRRLRDPLQVHPLLPLPARDAASSPRSLRSSRRENPLSFQIYGPSSQIHLPPAHLQKPVNKQFSLNSLLTMLRSTGSTTSTTSSSSSSSSTASSGAEKKDS